MKKCKNCKIEISGSLKQCPLCNQELLGKNTDNVFPNINNDRSNLLKKVLLLVSAIISILALFIEYYLTKRFYISNFIILGMITNYILVMLIYHNYSNVLKMVNKYFFVILLLLGAWCFITKSLLITTYFIPILCIIIYVFNSVTMLIYKDSYIIKYTKTILLDAVIGLLPLLFIFMGLTSNDFVSYLSVVMNVITFLGLIIFHKEHVLEELKKIFNI